MNEQPSREHARLLVAAVRVLSHRLQAPPTPDDVAVLLELPPEAVRLDLVHLTELGALRAIESAYALHLEVGDESLLADLPEEGSAPEIDEDLADFQRRKQEEAERMARLFGDGDHRRRQQQRVQDMEQELQSFRQRKPHNPFGDD